MRKRLEPFLPVASVTSHYTGFPNKTSVTVPSALSWDDGTYTLSLAPSGTTHDIYIDGIKYTIGTLTKQITDATGFNWFWITAPGGVPQLNVQATAPGFDQCLVATVYWNTTTNKGILSDERHWMGRDQWVHEYLHETVGARWAEGGTITPTAMTFAITECEFYDEDIEHILAADTTVNIMYKNGSADWAWDDAQTNLYKINGATSKMRYNNGNALADVAGNDYAAMWVFATNHLNTDGFAVIIGQRTDGSLNLARLNNTPDSLSYGTLPSAEMKLLYRVIFRQGAATITYQETADYRASSNIPVSNYTGTDHSVLSNLSFATAAHTDFLPKRGQMWGDEMTLLAGAALTSLNNSNQKHCMYGYHSAYANGDSAGWNFQCEAGDYTFTILYLKNTFSGIVDFYIDGVLILAGNDGYAVAVWNQILSISVTGLSAGRHTFKYIVNGKNVASTNYGFFVTKVYFKQATD